MKKNYIAYGSNISTDQMLYRCPGARVLGTGSILDYRLLFKGSKTGCYLTIEPYAGAYVPVVIWAIDEENEASLDRYEGFPRFYAKQNFVLDVKTLAYKTLHNVKAFAYVMNTKHKCGMPTDRYMSICQSGYKEFNFNMHVLWQAVADSQEVAYESGRY